ncbi:hypothetical protein ID866_5668 [Astraeus odoratus]|nr:hypothetical protein ID866_5668 [Astraeus odoratus]
MAVFDGVHYLLSPSLPPSRRHELKSILDLNGAAAVGPHTHVITLSGSNSHSDKLEEQSGKNVLKVVSDKWVDRSVIMGKMQPEQYYSPDPAMIFSGIVACATDLPASDVEVLSAGVTALGGQWRIGLTRDVTHLFALRPGSDKYNTALHFAPQTHMSIITPHWFDDSVRLGRRLPETPYTWPDPIVLRPGATLTIEDDTINNIDGRRRRQKATDAEDHSNVGEKEKVWGGRKILLSQSLELSNSQREAVEAGIKRAGGVLVKVGSVINEETEDRAVNSCDVFVTKWRSGKAYFKCRIQWNASFSFGFFALVSYSKGRSVRIGRFQKEISITNYTGAARDYLKRLITLMGAKFTPSLSMENKVLVAGFQPSPKTTRALAWSIPVVNHTWVEDCFVEWRALTVGLERYVVFPPGIDFGKILMNVDNAEDSSLANRSSLSSGVVPGGRGVGFIDVAREEARDAEYARNLETGGNRADGVNEGGVTPSKNPDENGLGNDAVRMDRGRSAHKISPSTRKNATRSRSRSTISTGAPMLSVELTPKDTYIDKVIEIPDDEDEDARPPKNKPRARPSQHSPASKPKSVTSTSNPRSASKSASPRAPFLGTSSSIKEVEAAVTLNPNEDEFLIGPENMDLGDFCDDRMDVDGSRQPTLGTRSNSKGKAKALVQPSEDDRFRNTGEKQPKAKPIAKSDGKASSTKPASHNMSTDKPRPKLVRRNSAASTAKSAHSDIVDQRQTRKDRSVSSTSLPKGKDAGSEERPIQLDSGFDSEPAPPSRRGGAPTVTPVKSGMKPKARPTPSRTELEETSDEDLYAGPNKGGKMKGKATSQGQASTKAAVRSNTPKSTITPNARSSTKENVARRSQTCSLSPPPSKNTIRTPKRTVSVLVPPLPKEYFTPGGSKKEAPYGNESKATEDLHSPQISKSGPVELALTSSVQAVAAEASASASRRGKPTPVGASLHEPIKNANASTSKCQPAEAVLDTDHDVFIAVDPPATTSSRNGLRRNAANKASAKLKEVVMPDVMNYEKERKSEKRRRSIGGESVLSLREGDEDDGRMGKKRKVDVEGAKEGTMGKMKKAKRQEAVEEAEVKLVVAIPKDRSMTTKMAKRKIVDPLDNSNDGESDRGRKSKAKIQEAKAVSENKNDRDRPPDAKIVRLMSTGVALSDEVIRCLAKLGVRMTSKPTDCTHLIAKGIVRTEKFLCAMSVSPYVLKEEWADACVASGKLLHAAEQDYLLVDPAAEKKWGFKFTEALQRSRLKGRGSQLFRNMSFYLTPKVPIDSKLLKAVVQSAGGQVQVTTPTVRILKAKTNRFVISCPEDASVWRPLVQEGYKIYSTEFILQAVLKQEIDWDSPESIVAGTGT